MQISRRHLALGGPLACAGAALLSPEGLAQAGDDAAVNQAIEDLNKAMLAADEAKLKDLVADQLSYGHSSGALESKEKFLSVVGGKKTIYKTISLADPTVVVVGSNAISRHILSTETESDGKPGSARVGVLQVWQKQDSRWRLLARQAYRLPS